MSVQITHPTPYPEVNAVLHALLSGVQTIIGNHFIGMYLHGSLATADFDSQRSDIDFVVVTADGLPEEMIQGLEAMHGRLTASGRKWATKLEGSYIPQDTLRRHGPADVPCPCVNEGRFYMARLGSDWVIQRHILREQGVVVTGPVPRTLIDPVQPNDLRRAVLGFLREWWLPLLHDPDPRLRGGEYQAYAVLTMCRALYTLQHGTAVSKSLAARWGQEALGERWSALIEWALAWRDDEQSEYMKETLDFIQYTLERSQLCPSCGRVMQRRLLLRPQGRRPP